MLPEGRVEVISLGNISGMCVGKKEIYSLANFLKKYIKEIYIFGTKQNKKPSK